MVLSCYRPDFNQKDRQSLVFRAKEPFDITNMAVDDPNHFDSTIDFKNGRSGNGGRSF